MTDTGAHRHARLRAAVFLDRDGTLTELAAGRYIVDPDELRLRDGAGVAVRRLNEVGLPVFVVTNQQGVSSGELTTARLALIHQRLIDLLADEGAELEGIYVCPHLAGTCSCRKPADGLLRQAMEEHPISSRRSSIVGDAITDAQAGTRLGLFRVLVGGSVEPADRHHVDLVVPDLSDAVEAILGRLVGP